MNYCNNYSCTDARQGLSSLQNILNNTLKNKGLRKTMLTARALSIYKKVVGESISSASIPKEIKNGVMFVVCRSSSWANELNLLKDEIIKKINSHLGEEIIKDIKFSSRGYRQVSSNGNYNNSNFYYKTQEKPFSLRDDEVREIMAKVEDIKSVELQEKVLKTLMYIRNRDKQDKKL